MSTLITNAHIISPDLEIEHGSILIENGKIAGVYNNPENIPSADETYDAGGNYAFPGFVDIHAMVPTLETSAIITLKAFATLLRRSSKKVSLLGYLQL